MSSLITESQITFSFLRSFDQRSPVHREACISGWEEIQQQETDIATYRLNGPRDRCSDYCKKNTSTF